MKINQYFVSIRRVFSAILLYGGIVCFGFYLHQTGVLDGWSDSEIFSHFKQTELGKLVWEAVHQLVYDVGLNPYFYLPVVLIFFLELLIPAKKQQKIFSVGILQDFVWFISDILLKIFIITPYSLVVLFFCRKYLSAFAVKNTINFPPFVSFLFAVLLLDFLSWLIHLLYHKVQFLWNFHAVHHAQRELNLFTDLRFHIAEHLINLPLIIIPLYLLHTPPPAVAYYVLFRMWYPRFYHANIKSNYGFFKYFLVTPQSHRVHHSFLIQHQDKNFGILFSIWDRLFNTQYKIDNEYPDTGITDSSFPVETSSKFSSLLITYWKQQIYPFSQLLSK